MNRKMGSRENLMSASERTFGVFEEMAGLLEARVLAFGEWSDSRGW